MSIKNKDKKLLNKYSGLIRKANFAFIESCKPLLSKKENGFLLDLILGIQSYNFGVLMQARADFVKNNLEGKAVRIFIEQEQEEGTYSKKSIREVKSNVDKFFQTSFDNQRSEKIENLVLDEELSHIVAALDPVYNEGYEPLSPRGDFEENFLPQYNFLRKELAEDLLEELDLSGNRLSGLQQSVFNEVVGLANKKLPRRGPTQDYLVRMGDIVGFLERGITIYLPKFLQDLGLEHAIVSLVDLRKNTKRRFNTVCWRCSRQLSKKDTKHYCTRKENRPCYRARLKERKQSGFPPVILRTKNKCDACGAYASLDYIYKSRKQGGEQLQFCSQRCWERFRKSDYRKRKRIEQLNPSSEPQ